MNRKEVDIKFLMERLNVTREQAIDLILFDSGNVSQPEISIEVTKTATNKKSGIQENELNRMKEILSTAFGDGKEFKSRDVSEVIAEELSITARAVPSRLKKLVDSNFLEDLGGSPKSYKVL